MKSALFLALVVFSAPAFAADIDVAKGKSVVKCVVKEGGADAAAEASAELTSVLNNLQVQVSTSDSSMGAGFSIRYTVRPPFAVSQPTLTLVENRRTGGFVGTVCVTLTKE
jgi:hypothetical protein